MFVLPKEIFSQRFDFKHGNYEVPILRKVHIDTTDKTLMFGGFAEVVPEDALRYVQRTREYLEAIEKAATMLQKERGE